MLKPQDVQSISELLMTRVVPKSAGEGVAIAQLVQRLIDDQKPATSVIPVGVKRRVGPKP